MDNNLKLVFMGTSGFAVPSLLKLIDSKYDVALVVSQPDRKKGRGRVLSPTPVKEAAAMHNLALFQPQNINSKESVGKIKEQNPDVIVVVAYGQILSQKILDVPKAGCINVHASLLPKLRGAAPINWAIVGGDKKTGVTSMLMDAGMDTGDVLLKKEIDIDDEIDAAKLAEKLSIISGEILIRTLDMMKDNILKATKQNDKEATYAPVLKKADGAVSFADKDAAQVHNMVRGLCPWPGAFTSYDGKTIKLLKTSYDLDEDAKGFAPGTVVMVTRESFFIAAKKGVVEIFSLQPQNKKVMPAKDFINGYGIKAGAVFS
jgi:methionyl-tRNA formyltransferase